jgi:hypothetical protein
LKGDECHGHGAVASEEPIEAGRRLAAGRTFYLRIGLDDVCAAAGEREVAAISMCRLLHPLACVAPVYSRAS